MSDELTSEAWRTMSDEAQLEFVALRARYEAMAALVEEYQSAAMLNVGGDPSGVTPAHVTGEITSLRDALVHTWHCMDRLCDRCDSMRPMIQELEGGVTPGPGSLPHESAGPPVAAGDPKKPE